MDKFIIYGLTDPETNQIRYIGKSTSGLYRPRQHGTPCRLDGNETRRARWIRSLQAKGLTYGIIVLQTLPSADLLYAAEMECIARVRAEGADLTNHTDGGPGLQGVKRSAEYCAQLSERFRGVPLSEQHRQRLSEAHKGNKPSAETLAKMSQTRKGRTPSPEHRQALSQALQGHKLSDETRKKISDAHRARKELREKAASDAATNQSRKG